MMLRFTFYGVALAFATSVIFCPLSAAAQANDLIVPAPVGFINDFAGFLRPATRAVLETKLQAFRDETGHEIVVAIADSLQETTIEDLAVRWFEEWKIGTAEADNGILMLVVPPEHVMRIEVGYGLESVVPDSVAQSVGDNIVSAKFRAGDNDGGVIAGVDALIGLARGEELDFASQNSNAKAESQIGLVMFVVSLFFIGWGIYDRLASVDKLQKTLRRTAPRGVLAGLLSVIGGWIAGLSGFLHPLLWMVIFGGTIGVLIFYLTKNAGKFRGGGGFWHSGGGGWSSGGSGFGGFGGGSSGGGGATSRW